MPEIVLQESKETKQNTEVTKYIEELIEETVKNNLFKKTETPIQKNILCENPLIYTIDNYLSDEEFITIKHKNIDNIMTHGTMTIQKKHYAV